ncbi:MAG: hypothetical protein ABI910_09200 [Gemmatimonadota bacterium]
MINSSSVQSGYLSPVFIRKVRSVHRAPFFRDPTLWNGAVSFPVWMSSGCNYPSDNPKKNRSLASVGDEHESALFPTLSCTAPAAALSALKRVPWGAGK